MLLVKHEFPNDLNFIVSNIRTRRRVVEGELRCGQLKEYLENLNVEKDVWISEDGSGIVQNIHYDSVFDQLVGHVLPNAPNTASPIPFSFKARDGDEIIKHMTNTNLKKSCLVYLVMAQPLSETVPPFVLQIFGTDNRFTKEDVVKRWSYTRSELAKHDIRLIGISSDGDHRLLASMIHQIEHQCEYKFVQDTIHIGTKLRNRLLKSSIVLPLGNSQISFAHLKILIKNVPKSTHGLTICDIDPKDRQNYSSFEKITSERVRRTLDERVVGSESTVMYLQKCQQITSSFMQHDLLPLERVYRMFNAVFFLRIWSSWIKSSRAYTLNENFITSNCYKSIEINAMNLISLIKLFRDENANEKFLPTLFDSQTCEKMFRHFRSMGTANYTKINFTMFELLNLTRRAEMKNEIDQYKLSDVDILFPRRKHASKTKLADLPTDEEIQKTLDLAKHHALEEASRFQLTTNLTDIDNFRFSISKFRLDDVETEKENICPESDDDFDLIDLSADAHGDETYLDSVDHISIIDQYADDNEKNSYTLISDDKGAMSRIRKSALVWSLSAPSHKLSNDRLNRVKASAPKIYTGAQTNLHTFPKIAQKTKAENNVTTKSYVQILDTINIGDWCFFQNNNSEQILIGVVLRFQYANRKTVKDKFYAGDSVLRPEESKANTLEALSTFYHLSENGNLNSFPENHFNLNLSNYVATLIGITPTMQNENIFFSPADFLIVNKSLNEIK